MAPVALGDEAAIDVEAVGAIEEHLDSWLDGQGGPLVDIQVAFDVIGAPLLVPGCVGCDVALKPSVLIGFGFVDWVHKGIPVPSSY